MTSENLPSTSLWTRLLRGGVSLTPLDRFLLRRLEQHVPAEMATALRHQWRALKLIQRSPDWQELRFYRLVTDHAHRAELSKLPVRDGEVKLLSVALRPPGEAEALHVNFWAVDGGSSTSMRLDRCGSSVTSATWWSKRSSIRIVRISSGAAPSPRMQPTSATRPGIHEPRR
jgi:hypothetical protein